jgi:hypothetical protein
MFFVDVMVNPNCNEVIYIIWMNVSFEYSEF